MVSIPAPRRQDAVTLLYQLVQGANEYSVAAPIIWNAIYHLMGVPRLYRLPLNEYETVVGDGHPTLMNDKPLS